MSWLLVNADNSLVSITPSDTKPVAGPGQRPEEVALGYPDTVTWSQPKGGFVDIVTAQPLISVGRFKLLFTYAERTNMRAAASGSAQVEDFLDLLDGFTDGVSLSDPVMIAAIGQLQAAGLLTGDRAEAILAGQAPS